MPHIRWQTSARNRQWLAIQTETPQEQQPVAASDPMARDIQAHADVGDGIGTLQPVPGSAGT
jgi:hypothetical protein